MGRPVSGRFWHIFDCWSFKIFMSGSHSKATAASRFQERVKEKIYGSTNSQSESEKTTSQTTSTSEKEESQKEAMPEDLDKVSHKAVLDKRSRQTLLLFVSNLSRSLSNFSHFYCPLLWLSCSCLLFSRLQLRPQLLHFPAFSFGQCSTTLVDPRNLQLRIRPLTSCTLSF